MLPQTNPPTTRQRPEIGGRPTPSPNAESNGLLIIGHRGAAGLAPENTLAGFARAMALGVDGVELDVRVARNNVVVIHDATVDRTTNGRGLVAEMPLATLRELDAGDGQTIPTLAEVLAALPDDLMVNIELKGPGTAKPVAEVVRDHDVGGNAGIPRMLVSSFDHHELARFHELCPALACAPLASRWSDRLEDTVAALEAWSVNLADRAATEHRITRIRSWQRRCLVYTVNSPERARRLHALGVGGVFTDFPDRFRGIDFAVGRSRSETR